VIGVRANTKAHVTNWAMSENHGKKELPINFTIN